MWAIILIVINFQLEERGFELSGLGTKAVVWPVGTAIWTMFLLSSQKKAGTLLSMKLGNRVKTSIAIGENQGKKSLFSIEERIKDISNEINDIGIKDNVLCELDQLYHSEKFLLHYCHLTVLLN